jgi:hypothetical protein
MDLDKCNTEIAGEFTLTLLQFFPIDPVHLDFILDIRL